MTLKSFDNPNSDEARQALLDRRTERLHPKRHRTTKRSKALNRKKRMRIKNKVAEINRARRTYRLAAKAFWAGEGDHPPS